VFVLYYCFCLQVGTVVDDPMDNNRLSKGQRRATMTEQLLVDSELTSSRKRRFNKLQVRPRAQYRTVLRQHSFGGLC
jgi:hypothetical protein